MICLALAVIALALFAVYLGLATWGCVWRRELCSVCKKQCSFWQFLKGWLHRMYCWSPKDEWLAEQPPYWWV